MIYLLLCIISSSLIMVIFKKSGRIGLDNFNLILINYLTASILGFSIAGLPESGFIRSDWFPIASVIGILFISLFFVIAVSTQKAGIAVTSVASKMSVIIPILFSVIYFKEELTFLKVIGFLLSLSAVFLTIFPGRDIRKGSSFKLTLLFVPVVLFFGAGIIDSLIKLAQGTVINRQNPLIFSSTLFSIAAIAGLVIAIFRKNNLSHFRNKKLIPYGIILGLVNFGSLYGIIQALDSEIFDSSVIFGINNVGIVLLSVLLATVFFKEKLSTLNKAGIVLSMVTIIILSFV